MPTDTIRSITACRSCGCRRLVPVFDLGFMPITDRFSASATEPDPLYPLAVVCCDDCGLCQLQHTVDPELIFADDYHYFSSYTDTVVENAVANVEAALARKPLGGDGLVVELASNDGYLLKHVQARGIPVLGIDPAKSVVEAARAQGIDTVHAFFDRAVAQRIVDEGRQADLIFANNVLAHVAALSSFVEGIEILLRPSGTALIEVPYLKQLIEKTEFDTIYHEHLCYFSLTALDRLFRDRGLFLNDAEPIAIHGGSMRLFVEKRNARSERLERFLDDERASGLHQPAAFTRFADDVTSLGEQLKALLSEQKAKGAKIAGYGAAAKGTILLNAFGIGPETLDFVADKNPHKHGLYVPGVKLPIISPEEIAERQPDFLLILPWNHKDEIVRQQAAFADRGGRFIVPIPEPVVV